MLPLLELVVYYSSLTYARRLCELASRLYGLLWDPRSMHGRRQRLTSIPERSEAEDELAVNKWVPKQKHEVLKAKYKCLKKLFQVYDASLINMLPEPYVKAEEKPSKDSRGTNDEKTHKATKKKRKSHRRIREGDRSATESDKDCACVAGALMKDLRIKKCALGPTLVDQVGEGAKYANVRSIRAESSDFSSAVSVLADAAAPPAAPPLPPPPLLHHTPPMLHMQPPKLTRMQILKYRLFGHRPKAYRYNPGHIQSLSDPKVSNYGALPPLPPLRARRRLRLRRHRAKKVRSCDELGDASDPVLLSYAHTAQQSCLLDTTPRHCPYPGCNVVLNGIINYNDHLRMCHFPERKFVCRYCHEGFASVHDKSVHENEHIGIISGARASGAATSLPVAPTVLYENFKRASYAPSAERDKDVQCDVISEEKLKKIVSYFDKIATGDGSYDMIGKGTSRDSVSCRSHCSVARTRPRKKSFRCGNSQSCGNAFCRSESGEWTKPENIAIACRVCGEFFQFRKQLSSHMDEEHGKVDSPRFHSVCALPTKSGVSKDGELNVDSARAGGSGSDHSLRARRKEPELAKSATSVDYDPSTNIVYYNTTSMESICKKTSVFDKFVKRVKSVRSLQSGKWESSTKVVHV